MIAVSLQVRPAVPQDQHQIANLMFFESHVHRHLDWRAPLEWLGFPCYWVVEDAGRVLGVLACPQDPPEWPGCASLRMRGSYLWMMLGMHFGRLPKGNGKARWCNRGFDCHAPMVE